MRLTALLFGVSLLLGACSGNGLSSELEIIRAELEVLREELAGTKERLAEAQAENRALDDRITDLEAAGEYPIFRQTLDNGVTLIYELGQLDVGYNPLVERRASRLYVRYADGERRQVGGERGLSSISVSPDGTRLLYNDGFAGNFDAADGAEPGSLYVYDFEAEDFYIYMMAHMAKHFYKRGCGIRNLVDIYVFLEKFGGEMNADYLQKQFAGLGLTAFGEAGPDLAAGRAR